MITKKPCICGCPTNCTCNQNSEGSYIVVEPFWLQHVMLKKDQVIHGPVSPRWIQLGLIKQYSVKTAAAKKAAETAVKTAKVDESTKKVETSVKVPKTEKVIETPKCDTVIEVPQPSEVVLNEVAKTELKDLAKK